MAMRVWVKCMLSSANRLMAIRDSFVDLVSCMASRYISGSINTPTSAPMKRQPKGVMPKMRTPRLISTLPSGGCVHS